MTVDSTDDSLTVVDPLQRRLDKTARARPRPPSQKQWKQIEEPRQLGKTSQKRALKP